MTDSQSADLRIGDAERESAMTALGEHMSAGRLDIDEYGERTARVTAAKTRGELLALFDDLPAPYPSFGTGKAEQPAPAQVPEPGASNLPARRSGGQRFVEAMMPIAGLVGLGFLIFTHLWWLIFLPVFVGILGRAIVGDDWQDRKAWKHQQQWQHQQHMAHRDWALAQRQWHMEQRMARMHERMARRAYRHWNR